MCWNINDGKHAQNMIKCSMHFIKKKNAEEETHYSCVEHVNKSQECLKIFLDANIFNRTNNENHVDCCYA